MPNIKIAIKAIFDICELSGKTWIVLIEGKIHYQYIINMPINHKSDVLILNQHQ